MRASLLAGPPRLPLLFLLVASTAGAAELHTVNGELLIGKIVEEQPGFVVFESESLGRVTIERNRIARLTATSVPRVPPGEPAPEAQAEQATAPGKTLAEQAEETAAGERQEALSRDALGRFLARINPLKGWKTRLTFGFIGRRGDDNDNDLTLSFESERRTAGGDEHRLEARYYYAEDVLADDVRDATDELLTGGYRYRHDLSQRLILQSLSTYHRDAIKELNHELTQTVGVGARLEGERWGLALTPAIGAQWREVGGVDSGTHAVAALFQEARFDVTSTLRLTQTLDYIYSLEDSDDYSARLGVDLVQKLGTAWSLGLRYDYNYDAVVGKNASELQQRFTVNVGLEF